MKMPMVHSTRGTEQIVGFRRIIVLLSPEQRTPNKCGTDRTMQRNHYTNALKVQRNRKKEKQEKLYRQFNVGIVV